MSFRKEKKYRLSWSDFYALRRSLISKGMSQLFFPRVVCSVYYDTPVLDLYCDSEEGVLPRKKIRVRSYNRETPYYRETKVTSFEGRFKSSRVLLDSLSPPRRIIDNLYGMVEPKLSVTYTREYYQLKGLRITFDSDIKYRSSNAEITGVVEDTERVMEIKAVDSVSDDFINLLLPSSSTRFSKYCRGIDHTSNLWGKRY